MAWALESGEEAPATPVPALRQEGAGLGERLYRGLGRAAREAGGARAVAALGSDHPTVPLATLREAFVRIDDGADVALGPSLDGGYYLIALAPAAVRPELFAGIAWSTGEVLAQTLARARAAGLEVALLEPGADVDTPADLRRLAAALSAGAGAPASAIAARCPRTRDLLAAWGRLDPSHPPHDPSIRFPPPGGEGDDRPHPPRNPSIPFPPPGGEGDAPAREVVQGGAGAFRSERRSPGGAVRVLPAEAMSRVERAAVEEIGIPSMVLMENAALGLAEAVGGSFPDAASVAIYCGPGNNGGDGLALARHLAVRGYRVRCLLAFGGRETHGDAAAQLAICRTMAPDLVRLDEIGPDDALDEALAAGRAADLVVDALFGTGLSRPLEGQLAALVEGLNALPVPRLAVDLPSGLAGSRSETFGPHLVADLTVTFAAPKPAQVFSPAADAVGVLVVADLGIPPELLERSWGEEETLHLVLGEELAAWLPARCLDTHKGTYGHLLLVAGATGKAGAVILSARAAVRSGAGLVTAAVPRPIVQTVDLGSLESMSLALPADGDRLGSGAAKAILEAARGKDAVALGPGLGPGLGEDEPVAGEIREAVLACELPLVLDADGVNAFAGRAGDLASRPAPTVLTPHPGELARLLGVATREVVGDRRGFARRAARETGAVVVLKGHQTLTAAPEGAVHVNPTGNPGMATGGTGDVLTGLVGGLLAQGYDPLEGAILGVYLHGLAGDLAAAERGERGLAAGDLVDALPAAFEALAGS